MTYYTLDDHLEELYKEDPSLKGAIEKQMLNDLLTIQIKDLRKRKRLTQLQLAKKVGMTQSTIARIEGGNQNISMKTLSKLLIGLDAKIKIEA